MIASRRPSLTLSCTSFTLRRVLRPLLIMTKDVTQVEIVTPMVVIRLLITESESTLVTILNGWRLDNVELCNIEIDRVGDIRDKTRPTIVRVR